MIFVVPNVISRQARPIFRMSSSSRFYSFYRRSSWHMFWRTSNSVDFSRWPWVSRFAKCLLSSISSSFRFDRRSATSVWSWPSSSMSSSIIPSVWIRRNWLCRRNSPRRTRIEAGLSIRSPRTRRISGLPPLCPHYWQQFWSSWINKSPQWSSIERRINWR